MSSKDYDLHIRVVGWLYVAGGFLFVAAGLFVFLFFAGIGVGSGELKAMGILGAIGFATGLFMCLIALPGLITGWGILTRRSWARMLGIVVGILELAIVPVGTIIGGYSLWILLEKEAETYFDQPVPA